MSYIIQNSICEICSKKARAAVTDSKFKVHYFCKEHYNDSIDKYLDLDPTV